MRHILSRVAALIIDFGTRPLTLDDFHRECDRLNICYYESPLEWLHGCTWTDSRGTRICLNRHLPPREKLRAAWHELGHVLLHPAPRALLQSHGQWTPRDKWEAEADAVAVIAMLPHPMEGRTAETNLEWARYQLFERYGL